MITLRKAALCTMALFTLCMGTASAQKLKIATVDMQSLFKDYYRTAEEQKNINVERAHIQKDNNERLTRVREISDNLDKLRKQIQDPSISDKKKQELTAEFSSLAEEGQAIDRERQEFLQRRNNQLNEKMVERMRDILNEIRKTVEDQAKTEDYDYVFDKSGLSTTQVPFLLYTKDATDITPGLLERLNESAPEEAAEEPAGE